MTQQMQLYCVNIGNQLNFQHQPNENIPLKKVESDHCNENPTHLLTASTADRNLNLPWDPQLSGNNVQAFHKGIAKKKWHNPLTTQWNGRKQIIKRKGFVFFLKWLCTYYKACTLGIFIGMRNTRNILSAKFRLYKWVLKRRQKA